MQITGWVWMMMESWLYSYRDHVRQNPCYQRIVIKTYEKTNQSWRKANTNKVLGNLVPGPNCPFPQSLSKSHFQKEYWNPKNCQHDCVRDKERNCFIFTKAKKNRAFFFWFHPNKHHIFTKPKGTIELFKCINYTSAMGLNEIRKSPNVSQPNCIANKRQDVRYFGTPCVSFFWGNQLIWWIHF